MEEFQSLLNIPPSLNFTTAVVQNCFTIDIPLLSVQFVEGNSGEIILEIVASGQGGVGPVLDTAVVTVSEALRVQLVVPPAVNVSEGTNAVVCFEALLGRSKVLAEQNFQLNLTLEVIDVSASKLFVSGVEEDEKLCRV